MSGRGHQESANRRAGWCLRSFLTCRHVGPSRRCLGNARSTTRLDHSSATRRRQGVPRRRSTQLTRDRILLRVRRGVYRLRGAPTTWEQALLAAMLAGGDTAQSRLTRRPPACGHSECSPTRGSRSRFFDREHPEIDGVDCSPHDASCRRKTRSSGRVFRARPSSGHCATRPSIFRFRSSARTLDDGLRRTITSLDRLRECVLRLDSGPRRRLTVIARVVAAARPRPTSGRAAAPSSECSACSKPPTCCCPSSNIGSESGGRTFVPRLRVRVAATVHRVLRARQPQHAERRRLRQRAIDAPVERRLAAAHLHRRRRRTQRSCARTREAIGSGAADEPVTPLLRHVMAD